MANDLTHGNGAWRLAVTRRWRGTATLNSHFGTGWSDQNAVQLTLVSPDVLLVWRGGVGTNMAHRIGEKLFEASGGEKFQQTEQGWAVQLPHGRSLTFDSSGRMTSEQNATGPATSYAYDKSGRLVSVGTGAENQLRFSYDKAGHVTRVDGPEGLALDYAYDDKGRLASVLDARKIRTEYRYGDDGRLIAAKDQFGNQAELETMTAIGQTPAKPAARTATVPDFSAAKYQFDAQGRIKSAVEGTKAKSYEYDEAGRVSAISAAEGRATCAYDAFGRIASIRNADGTSTQFAYNNLDLPTSITKPDGTSEKRAYDAHGRLVRRESLPGDWEEISYDSAGRTERRRTPPASEVRYSYDDADRILGVKFSDGRTVSFEYDPSGRLLGQAWSSGEKQMWRYDTNGRLAESVSAAGLSTKYTYDASGRIVATEDQIHGKTTRRPFPGGMILEAPQGRTVTTTTKWGKPLVVVEPGGTRTAFNYDEKGRLRSVLSPLNLPWRYEYNEGGMLTSIVAPSGLRTSTDWNAQGRETKVARGNVAWREFHYDAAGRIEQQYSATGRAMRYAYDREGRLSELELPDGKVSYKSSDGGRQLVSKGPGYEVAEEFTGDGILTRRQYQPAGLDLKLPLDSAGRMAGIELNTLKAACSYDARGQLSQIALPGGATIRVTGDEAGRPVEIAFGSVMEKIRYDRADRITAIEADTSAGTRIFSERYSYDEAGNLAERITDSAEPARFEYDAESRLLRASAGKVRQIFAYDVDGNLTTNASGTMRCDTDALGRPAQQGPVSYSWDAGGNLVSVQNGRTRTDHSFDAAGRLIERRDGKGAWKFGYLDGTDRLWKDSAAGRSWYAYAGERLAGLKDEAGVTWLLVCLPGTDRPLAVCGSNGTTLFILHDRLGSARRFVDASGTVVARDDYAAFGNPELSEGMTPLRLFAGMMLDETGLLYARQRYYDPAIARFMSIDPLIGTPGVPSSHNAYAYAANNPLRYRDPMGTGSFEDEVVNLNKQYPSVLGKPDEHGLRKPLTHESGPFKGEEIVDKKGGLSSVENQAYSSLTDAEKAATRQAWEAKQVALQQLQNPNSTASQVKAAAQALAQHDGELNRLVEIGNLRYGHTMMDWGTLKGYGGKGSDAALTRVEQRLSDLGADPLAHYSQRRQDEIRALQASGIKPSETPQAQAAAKEVAAAQAAAEAKAAADAEAAVREARDAAGFGQNGGTQALGTKPQSNTAPLGTGQAPGSNTLPNPGAEAGTTGAAPGLQSSELAAQARAKIEQSIRNNYALNLSKEEMAAYKAEEEARAAASKTGLNSVPKDAPGTGAAGENPLVPALTNKTGTGAGGDIPPGAGGKAGTTTGGVGNTSGEFDPGIMKDGKIRDIGMVKNANGEWVKKPEPPGGTAGLADASDPYVGGMSGKTPTPRDIPMKFDPKDGTWKPGGAGAAEGAGLRSAGEAGERWLGPKILNAAGKVLQAAEPYLGPLMGIMAGVDAGRLGGTMAQNFMNTLNQPFMQAQTEKDAAKWVAARLANELRQLAAADPGLVKTPDGHPFDPNNPRDLFDLLQGLNQNLFFKRKPFDGLLTRETNKPTSFMGPAKGDTALPLTLENARKLMEGAMTLAKAANEAAKEATREQDEAKSQLENVIKVAGVRAVAEGDLATLPETAAEVQAQTAAVREQTKALNAAFDQMKAAGAKCESAATTICNLAAQVNGATEDQIKAFRVQATSALFEASDALNAAQAKIDSTDVSLDQLAKSAAALEGFRSGLMVFKAGSGLANAGGLTPDVAMTAAKSAAERANAAREKFNATVEQLRGIPPQITALLAPYVDNNVQAAVLDAQARGLGADIETPPAIDLGALITLAAPAIQTALTYQKNVENAIGSLNLDAIISAANDALSEARTVRTAAKAAASGPERYQALQRASECLSRIKLPEPTVAKTDPNNNPPTPPPATTDDDVVVPDLSVFSESGEMKAVLAKAGLRPGFAMSKNDPPKDTEFKWFAGQSPKPNAKVKKDSVVTIFAYQPPSDPAGPKPTGTPAPATGETKPGTMPNLVGLTLDQAATRLTNRMRIGSDEIGNRKPPTPDLALTIYFQKPAPGDPLPTDKAVVVTVLRYGSAKEDPAPGGMGDPFAGTWELAQPVPGKKPMPPAVITREGGTYVVVGVHEEGGKPFPLRGGTVQDGRLVFSSELNLGDMVGLAIGEARSEKKPKDPNAILKFRWSFTPAGDELQFVMEASPEPGKPPEKVLGPINLHRRQ